MADDNRLRFPLAGASYARATPQPSPARVAPEPEDNGDPLEELARLIGQGDNAYGQKRREQAAAPSRRLSAVPAPAHEAYQSADTFEETDYAARIYGYQPQRSSARAEREPPVATPHHAASPPHAEAYYDDGLNAAANPALADETGYAEDYGYEEAPPPERRRGGWMVIGAVLGLAVVGTAGAVGYRVMKSGTTGKPPIITADKSPTKILAPAAADNQTGAIRSLRNDTPQDSKMLVREEQPVEMREAKPPAPRMLPYAGTAAANAPSAAAAPPDTQALALANEPRKVHTLSIRPDGTVMPERPAARAKAAVPSARPNASAPTQTASIQPSEKPQAAKPAGQLAAGSHVVQLTSQRTEVEAQASFRSLQTKYPSILGSQHALIRKVDLGQRGTYYRAQVGPFASLDQATELCGHLKAAGGQCIVQKN